jgi:deoxyribose-phosphate aldolase
VCVYHALVPTAVAALAGSGIPVAAVSTGFPAGLTPLEQRLRRSTPRWRPAPRDRHRHHPRHVLTGDWQALYDEVRAFREACGDAHLKAILATGELGTLRNVARASLVAMMAGADFIKTSTGKEASTPRCRCRW